MRALAALAGLIVGLAGCSASDAPEAPAAAEGHPDLERLSEPHADSEFAGVYSQVVTVREPSGTQTNFGREGDLVIQVEEGATSLEVVAKVSGSTPGDWEMCVTQGDPHDGVCAVGASRIEVEVAGTDLATGDWSPWFFVPEGTVPAGAAVAMEIAWTATVTYG